MSTIAIVGAGTGLGAAVAREFAQHGFSIALISRTQAHVDAIATELRESGATAYGFAADVRDGQQLASALGRAARTLGPIEVLQYSPVPHSDFMKPVLDTTAAELRGPIEQSVYGPITAVQEVLPGMRALRRGTIIFVNGGSAVRPAIRYAGTSIAFAAESAYGQLLHGALAEENIHVSQLIIPGAIEPGDPTNDPTTIAKTLWTLHTDRNVYRHFTRPLD
ncbi:SDR family NAD(P)-dependent oxidoreductase [Microbacterium allomyrinae]|uniref:SDR family NAD(P)-dependent oxidoreductase n=1 Tax=Microbacterium allomyrinae TaxID=2830666 RepID=A0A9X1LVL7_9MICO|nr:SDR family NAD(P)-dependent oxidoreductase [Microbacterium allomyrinae]MCC2032611.1 SDR family NAD(P)-dependent oxidoreductase [Microbacterium allomyrinae]